MERHLPKSERNTIDASHSVVSDQSHTRLFAASFLIIGALCSPILFGGALWLGFGVGSALAVTFVLAAPVTIVMTACLAIVGAVRRNHCQSK